eukprot:scaffold5281_cov277-Pinguiococcus_pyrenoidosus.AAC.2
MATFDGVLEELSQANVNEWQRAATEAGNLKDTVFDLFFRLTNVDRNAKPAVICSAITNLCGNQDTGLTTKDIEHLALLIATLRKAQYPVFCPITQQMLSNSDRIQGNTLLRRQLQVGERYAVLFVPIECQTRDSGCPIRLERMLNNCATGETRVRWMKYGKRIYDPVHNYGTNGFTFSAGMVAMVDAKYTEFRKQTAAHSQEVCREISASFDESSSMPMYLVQSLICVRASVWSPTFKPFRKLLIENNRPFRNLILIDGMVISRATATSKMYLNTASDDETDLQATSNIVDTKLDFAKLLTFCKLVYQVAAACDVDFTQDRDNDDHDDDNGDEFGPDGSLLNVKIPAQRAQTPPMEESEDATQSLGVSEISTPSPKKKRRVQ